MSFSATTFQTAHAEQRSFWLIFSAFGAFGLMYGVWQVILVDLSRSLHLGLGTLGAALSFGSLASLPVMLLGGRVADRSGAGRVLGASALALALALVAIASVGAYVPLLALLLLFSGAAGLYDVGLNALSVRHEQRAGRNVLTSFHASFSGFAALGALLSGGLLSLGTPFRALYVGVALLLTVLAVLVGRSAALAATEAPPAASPVVQPPARSVYREPLVWLLAGLAVLTFFNEGSLETWAALYLRESLGVTVFVGAFGVMAIHSAMLLGRLLSARALKRIPRRSWLIGAGTFGLLGAVLALATTVPALAMAGFLLAALSYAGVLPIIFSLAGDHADHTNHAGARVGQVTSAITTIGYLGFLAGPGVIGGAAQLSSLRLALGCLGLASLLIALLARRVPLKQGK